MNESPDNHLVKAMVPVYKQAALIKGRAGTPQKRCAEFQRQVSARSNVWAKMCDGVRAEFKSYLDEDRKELKMQMQKYFAGIDRKFNVLCSDAKSEEPAETELRGKLQHNVAQADEKLVNDVLPRLETCFGKTASDMLLREIYS